MTRKPYDYPRVPVDPRYGQVKSTIRWINRGLLEGLIKRLDFSLNQFKLLINDTNGWIYKMNKTQKTLSYPNLRIAADILGIPVWFLAYGDKNKQFLTEFERLKPTMPILSASGLVSSVEYLKRSIENKGSDYPSRSIDMKALDRIQANLFNNDLNTQGDFLNEFRDRYNRSLINFEYPWLTRFNVEDLHGASNGVFQYFATPLNESDRLFSAWMFLNQDRELPLPSVTSLIKRVSDVLQCEGAKFSAQSSKNFDGYNILYLWNSEQSSIDSRLASTIQQLIESNLPTTNINSVVHLKTTISAVDNNTHNRDLDDLIDWLLDGDEEVETAYIQGSLFESNDYEKPLTNRKTLPTLMDSGYIQDGTELEFIRFRDPSTNRVMTSKGRATVHAMANSILLRWEEDHKLYSISRLSKILLEWPKRGIDGNLYWAKPGESRSLYKVVRELAAYGEMPSISDGFPKN